MKPARLLALLAGFLAVVCFTARLGAQGETTAAIAGFVLDPSGAAVSKASVTLISGDNGWKRSVKSDEGGRFSFPQLKPGPYSLKVEAGGFESQTGGPVIAGLGQTQAINFSLK